MKNYFGFSLVVVLFCSIASVSAQGQGRSSISGRPSGAQGVQGSLDRQKERNEQGRQMRERQRRESPIGGGKQSPIDRDLVRRKPLS